MSGVAPSFPSSWKWRPPNEVDGKVLAVVEAASHFLSCLSGRFACSLLSSFPFYPRWLARRNLHHVLHLAALPPDLEPRLQSIWRCSPSCYSERRGEVHPSPLSYLVCYPPSPPSPHFPLPPSPSPLRSCSTFPEWCRKAFSRWSTSSATS
jgi:hypothetical protein